MHSDGELAKLRQAFADASRPSGGDSAACPEPARIFHAVSGGLSPDDLAEIVDHTIACASCAEDWRLARAIAADTDLLPHVQARSEKAAATSRWNKWTLALAAAATILIAAGTLLLRQAPEPLYREPASAPAIRALVEDGSAQPRDHVLLRWSEPAPNARYDLLVTTSDLDLLFRIGNIRATEYLVPSDALNSVPDGGKIAWQIEAVLPDGRRVSSPTFFVRIQ